jgi:predicted signal transduction protein with EAL and GGDEF domain
MATRERRGVISSDQQLQSRPLQAHALDLFTASSPTNRFDRFTGLIADVMGVEVCLLALVTRERQWIRFGNGLDRVTPERDTPLFEKTLSAGFFEVPDRRDSSDEGQEPAGDDSGLRFYAGTRLRGPHGRPMGVLGVMGGSPRQLSASERQRLADFADLVERELTVTQQLSEARSELQRTHLLDAVTQLPGPLLVDDKADAWIRDLRASERVVAVHVHIQNLGAINGAYGPEVGDELLRLVARRAHAAATDPIIVGRLPGARLIVLLRLDLDLRDLTTPVETLIVAMQESTDIATDTVSPVLAAGVAMAPTDAEDGAHLIECARQALQYEADSEAAPVIRFWDRATEQRDAHQARIPFRLHQAVERRALGIAFQPIRELADYRLVAMEALVRWEDNALGRVVPHSFIPHVEEDPRLSRALTHNVLEAACEQAMALGSGGPDVSVNIPAIELFKSDFAHFVLGVIDGTELPRERLILEITEHSVIGDPQSVAGTLNWLRDRGIRVALDDFGAGYSSLGYLRHLPVDIIKLDRSLVAELDIDAAAEEVATGIISIAHSLGLTVIAEGIETPGELEQVRALGCDQAQGFFVGPPLDAVDTAVWSVHSLPGTPEE